MSCTTGGRVLALVLGALVAACAGGENDNSEAAGGAGGVGGTGATAGAGGGGAGGSGGAPQEPHVPGSLIGDGTGAVEFAVVADATDGLAIPRDIGFHPERTGELWVVNREDDGTTIIFDATIDDSESEHRIDGYAMHFMEEVSSIAFGSKSYRDDYTFGTCQESENTYNGQAAPNYFMGPALWTADLEIFAKVDPEGLGSHLDMLHHSPNCMGIAHDVENAYWVFDGYHNQIVRYDFRADHDAGYDDHSDGVITFFDSPVVRRVADVPSHMELDKETGLLYVADTGKSRVLWFDTKSGQKAGDLQPRERGTVVEEWTDASWGVLVADTDELVEMPSGLALYGGALYVGDHATGEIVALDLEGNLLGRLDTGLGAGALMGIEVGPDERLYLVDAADNRVLRIEPAQ